MWFFVREIFVNDSKIGRRKGRDKFVGTETAKSRPKAVLEAVSVGNPRIFYKNQPTGCTCFQPVENPRFFSETR